MNRSRAQPDTAYRACRLLGLLFLLSSTVMVSPGAHTVHAQSSEPVRRVNVPYFPDNVRFGETALFWFGRVTSTENYADVRVGYNDQELYVHVAVFDRRLWYATTPSREELTAWDAVSLYLDLNAGHSGFLSADTYRFVAQVNWWESRTNYQAVYQGDGCAWIPATMAFTTISGWRGTAFNNDSDDRGWTMAFRIPFAGLGLSGPPEDGSEWGLALTLHDRDNAAGSPPIPDKWWPGNAEADRPASWGQLVFNPPAYQPPPVSLEGTTVVGHGLHEAVVVDGTVGGETTCGSGLDFWTEWGNANYAGITYFNVQNQSDVADWPCFSKYYVTFPLDSIPAGKVIISATLTLHQFGSSGQGWEPGPKPSYIQVFTVGESWHEDTLTWNNAPLAEENVAAAWVDPVVEFPGWPGVRWDWDVAGAAAQAYAAGLPLRLALYSSDEDYHSGKYFTSSNAEDWNAQGRPTLTVVWGEAEKGPSVQFLPVHVNDSDMATCHDFSGSGRVDISDVQAVAARWGQQFGDRDWNPRYDVDGDGVITVLDIAAVAGQLDRVCSC